MFLFSIDLKEDRRQDQNVVAHLSEEPNQPVVESNCIPNASYHQLNESVGE